MSVFPQPQPARCRGFTLLELMIAITIFAIITTFAYTGLDTVLETKRHTEQYLNRLAKLQLGLRLMQQDIEQAVDRPVRNEYGDEEPALRSGGLTELQLELTKSGYSNPMKLARSQLQRVGYLLEEKTLYRITWPVLDRAQDTQSRRQQLFDGIEEISFSFFDQKMEQKSSWPPTQSSQSETPTATLPKGVEVVIETTDMGTLRRVFRAPESQQEEQAADE
jgi:general secretion pathway protein J